MSPAKKSHKRSKSDAIIGTITDKASFLYSSTTHSYSTENIDQDHLRHGLAFGKCPQHLLTNSTAENPVKISASSCNLKELETKEDINQCCCWQVNYVAYFVIQLFFYLVCVQCILTRQFFINVLNLHCTLKKLLWFR